MTPNPISVSITGQIKLLFADLLLKICRYFQCEKGDKKDQKCDGDETPERPGPVLSAPALEEYVSPDAGEQGGSKREHQHCALPEDRSDQWDLLDEIDDERRIEDCRNDQRHHRQRHDFGATAPRDQADDGEHEGDHPDVVVVVPLKSGEALARLRKAIEPVKDPEEHVVKRKSPLCRA